MRRDEIMIRYRTERGIATIIWIALVVIATRIWWSGDIAAWIGMLVRTFRGDESMSSFSYVIVSLLGDAIYALILVVTYVVTDIRDGFRMWRDSRFPRDEPQDADTAIEAQAEPQAVTIADVLGNIQTGLVSLQEQIDEMKTAKPAAKTTRTRAAAK